MMNLLMAFILAFYFQKWHFMAFWDSKFGIPLAKKVGNTGITQFSNCFENVPKNKSIFDFDWTSL